MDTSDHKRDTTRVVGLWGLKKTMCIRTVRRSKRTGTTMAVQTWKKGSFVKVHFGDGVLYMAISLRN